MAAPESLNTPHDRPSWQHASNGAACSASHRGVSSSLNQRPCVGLGLPTSRFYRQLCRRRSSTAWFRNPREQDLIATALPPSKFADLIAKPKPPSTDERSLGVPA